MPRRRGVPKRKILPDAVYNSDLASRFINKLMMRGKKCVSEKIFYQAMGIIEKKTEEDSRKILKKALDNVKPIVETKSRRVGGSTYQVPIEVSTRCRVSLGIRWIVNYARERGAGRADVVHMAERHEARVLCQIPLHMSHCSRGSIQEAQEICQVRS